MEDQDLEIICSEPGCGKSFLFTVSEQKYFKDRNLYQPKRCPDCRKARKQRVQSDPPDTSYNRGY